MTALAAGARTMLAADTSITDLLGSDDVWDTYLFQDRLYARVEGSGQVAVVLDGGRGPWTSPNAHNTMRFPRLVVSFWADPTRDPSGNVVEEDAADKIEAVFNRIDRRLHRAQGGAVWWGGVRIIGSTRMGEPDYEPVPDGDGLTRAQINYGITVG